MIYDSLLVLRRYGDLFNKMLFDYTYTIAIGKNIEMYTFSAEETTCLQECIKCSHIFAWAHTFIKILFPGAQQHFQYYIITLMHDVVGG